MGRECRGRGQGASPPRTNVPFGYGRLPLPRTLERARRDQRDVNYAPLPRMPPNVRMFGRPPPTAPPPGVGICPNGQRRERPRVQDGDELSSANSGPRSLSPTPRQSWRQSDVSQAAAAALMRQAGQPPQGTAVLILPEGQRTGKPETSGGQFLPHLLCSDKQESHLRFQASRRVQRR